MESPMDSDSSDELAVSPEIAPASGTDRQEPQPPGTGAREGAAGPASLGLDLKTTLENITIVGSRVLIDIDAIVKSCCLPKLEAELQQRKEEDEAAFNITGMQLLFAGKKPKIIPDKIVKGRFQELKQSIFSFTKQTTSPSTPELHVLALSSEIATLVHGACFSPDSKLFGYGDHLGSQNPLYLFEKYLRDSGCDRKSISCQATLRPMKTIHTNTHTHTYT